jgi:hypothetical protein
MPSPVNTTRYKSYRNLFNRLVRLSRKMYYEEQLSANISNLRKTWQILNEALNIPKNKQSISKIMVSNTLIDNPLEISNQFNTFFTSIANEISSKSILASKTVTRWCLTVILSCPVSR